MSDGPGAADEAPAAESVHQSESMHPSEAIREAPSSGEVPRSLLPTVPPRRPRMDTQAWWGLALLVLMGAIGFGGWLATQGSYRDPPVAAAPVQSPQALSNPPQRPALPVAPNPPPVAASRGASPEKLAEPPPPSSIGAATSRGPAARKKAEASLPDIPNRDEVRAALLPLRAALAECARGRSGVAQLDLTVANTGSVTNAVVGGDFAGSAEGSCIARAARTAHFTRFKKPRFRVIYPFSL